MKRTDARTASPHEATSTCPVSASAALFPLASRDNEHQVHDRPQARRVRWRHDEADEIVTASAKGADRSQESPGPKGDETQGLDRTGKELVGAPRGERKEREQKRAHPVVPRVAPGQKPSDDQNRDDTIAECARDGGASAAVERNEKSVATRFTAKPMDQ